MLCIFSIDAALANAEDSETKQHVNADNDQDARGCVRQHGAEPER